ncbi:MAG: SDR family oxidoreductase [archaeon]
MGAIEEKMIFLIGKGFLGEKLVSVFRKKGIKIVTADIAGKVDYSLDITDEQSLIYLFKDLNPDIVLLTAGITSVDFCEAHKIQATEVNFEGTRNVVDACRAFNSKLVFFSTDYVFDGIKGNYTENDKTNPINFYGKTKVQGEELVKGTDSFLIARVSLLYGFNSIEDKNTFVCYAIEQLKNHKEVLVANITNSPTLIDDAAEAVYFMLEKNFSGLFHVAGSESCSRYDLLMKICRVFELDSSLVKQAVGVPGWKAKRPVDSSLDITKIQLQGIKMSSVEEGLIKVKKQMNL